MKKKKQHNQPQLGFENLAQDLNQKNLFKSIKYFGGVLLKNSNPKIKRPISTKKPMHLVLRSSLAKGQLSLLKKNKQIQQLIRHQGKKHGVKVYSLANAGNHLHLVVLPRSREAFQAFVRSISGLIARLILKVERGNSKGLQFWDKRPFTRIIEWGKEFRTVSNYLLQNTLEAFGFIPYKPRIVNAGRYNLGTKLNTV